MNREKHNSNPTPNLSNFVGQPLFVTDQQHQWQSNEVRINQHSKTVNILKPPPVVNPGTIPVVSLINQQEPLPNGTQHRLPQAIINQPRQNLMTSASTRYPNNNHHRRPFLYRTSLYPMRR